MFCTNCGKQLDQGAKFCTYCGKPQAAATPPAQQPTQQIPLDPQIDLYQEPAQTPSYHPVPPDAHMYADPKPPAPEKKRRKKGGLIAVIAVILVLVIGGGAGFYLYNQHMYEENLAAYNAAKIMQKQGNYDGALSAFLELGNFEDAASRAKELQKLQNAYDEALELLEDKDYEGARSAFEDLGDYRDSRNFVANEITYQQAQQMMAEARETQSFDFAVRQYWDAAHMLVELGDYSDAANLASECFLEYGLCMLDSGMPDMAMYGLEWMNEADASYLLSVMGETGEDGPFLQTLREALLTWYDAENRYTYAQELSLAWDLVQPYEGTDFADPSLADVLDNFQYGLQLMYNSLYDEDSVDYWSDYYLGEYFVFYVAEEMYYSYGMFANEPENMDRFIGMADLCYIYSELEYSMENWWDKTATAERMSDGRYYAAYTNDTGYSFTLQVTVFFYDANDKLLETGKEQEIYVAKGATVYIPLIPTQISDSAWQTWNIYWDFTGVS